MRVFASLPALTLPLFFLACSTSPGDSDVVGAGGGAMMPTGGVSSGGMPNGGSGAGGAGAGGDVSGSISGGGTGVMTGGTAGSGGSTAGASGAAPGAGGTDPGVGGTDGGGGATNGGSGGGASSGNGGGASSGGGCESSDLLCETFEGFDVGSVPMDGRWTGIAGECSSGPFSLGVSDEEAFEGSKALKATNSSWAQCRVAGSFGAADEFWVTAHLYVSATMDLSDKEVMAIDLAPSDQLTTDGASIRFGSRTKAPCTESGGPQVTLFNVGGGEQTGCSGQVEYPQGRWFCFEAHVKQAGPTDVRTYIDGTAISYLAQGWDMEKESISTAPEANVVKMDHVRLGLFSNTMAEGDAYIDALSVSTTRVGCE